MNLGALGSSSFRVTRPAQSAGNAFCEPNPELELRSSFDDAWQRILSQPDTPGNGAVPAHWSLQENGWYVYQLRKLGQ